MVTGNTPICTQIKPNAGEFLQTYPCFFLLTPMREEQLCLPIESCREFLSPDPLGSGELRSTLSSKWLTDDKLWEVATKLEVGVVALVGEKKD
jgi:hypothetical protein